MTTHPTGDAPAAAHAKRLAEATEIISAGVADDLSSEEIAGNVLSMVECEAILSAPAASERVVDQRELEMLRKVAWNAQGLLLADELVHPTLSRQDAIRESTDRLRQSLGQWQMEFTACDAKAMREGE